MEGWEGGGEDSSLDLLYRLLLAEMYGNGSSGGLNNRWIERDSLLQVGGAASIGFKRVGVEGVGWLAR